MVSLPPMAILSAGTAAPQSTASDFAAHKEIKRRKGKKGTACPVSKLILPQPSTYFEDYFIENTNFVDYYPMQKREVLKRRRPKGGGIVYTVGEGKKITPERLFRGYLGKRYLIMEAISAAKFSSFFSIPSPFSKRTASLKVTVPPSALAALSIYFSTDMLLSFTNSCCMRQFSA